MTDEVFIRPLCVEDPPAVQRYAADEQVARTTNTPWPYPEDGGEQFVENRMAAHAEGRSFSFAILFHGDLIGVVGINAANREEMSESCDYAIASSHWNKGIATRAVALALRFAFVELGLKAIRSACLQRNPASGRVLRKNRFREIGEFLYSSSKFQNEPALNFELLRHVWISPSSSSTSAAPRSPDWSP